jgi:hypothetical protein
MLGSSYDVYTLKHKREIGQATTTNPYSRGGLLPLHGGDDGADVREGGEASEVTPAAFPPPIFAGRASVSVFRVSLTPCLGIVKGGSIYRRF